MTTFQYRLLGMAVASCLLSACTTTGTVATTQTSKISPKGTLEHAIKSQFRSSFDYESSVYVSNDIRRDALTHATTEQLNAAPTYTQCEDAHDKAYVALLQNIKAEQGNISDDKYAPQKERIKHQFLTCQEEQEKQSRYQPFDLEAFYHDTKHSDADSQAWAFALAMENHLAKQAPKEIDTSHTALDAKKAKLLHEYLIRPSSIQISGSYQPLLGKITALPALNYTAKNLKMAVQQPIYIDLKAEKLYIWADNVAPLNSLILDNKLGDTWHNKWLYIPLNDGSLPKDFTKDLIKAYLNAQKESFMALPSDDFLVTNSKSVTDLPFISQNLSSDKLTLIQSTPTIIKNITNTKNKAYSEYVFADTLFQEITTKYPHLTLQTPDFYEREIVDGESVIHVVNAINGDEQPDTDNQEKSNELKINSELLVRGLLWSLSKKIDGYYHELYMSPSEEEPDVTTSKYAPTTHYGITNGKISWVHYRHYINHPTLNGDVAQDEPLLIDVFTQIFPHAKMREFDRLPSNSRIPTSDNSVDLFAYQEALRTRLNESDETPPFLDAYLKYKMMSDYNTGNVEIPPDDFENDDDGSDHSEDEVVEPPLPLLP